MDKDLHSLQACKLFEGIAAENLPTLLTCFKARRQDYDRDETILSSGGRPREVGVIMRGSANIIKEDYWGNRSLIQKLQAADVFAESFALAGVETLPFSVIAAEKTQALYLDTTGMLSSCALTCVFHTQLIFNIVQLLAHKNILLTRKIEHIAMRSTKEKLLSYLSSQALDADSGSFAIPYNRQELADYLCVDRSALSSVLSRLKQEGMLDYHRNDFRVLKQANS